jgi:hypothetical protein
MTEDPSRRGAPRASADERRAPEQDLFGLEGLERRAALEWIGENLPYVRRSVFGNRLLYWSLAIGFVIGVAVHVAGYLLKSSATTQLLAVFADLLYALGWALWTGVVVTVFVQIIPETKRRQFKHALDAYEASVRDEASAGSGEASPDEFSS